MMKEGEKRYITEIQYFPCVAYIKHLIISSHTEIEACENFQKMSFRNRCVVSSNAGLVSLTVPLKNGREQKVPIREVEVDRSQQWQRQHFRTLVSCYRKAPFFDYYSSKVEELIFANSKYLFDLDMSILNWLWSVFKIKGDPVFTTDYQVSYSDDVFRDLRNKWLPKNFQQEGEDKFPRYTQVFEERIGFQPNLSILDLLFCQGPNAKNLLLSNV